MGLRTLLGMPGVDSGAEAGTRHASKEKDFHATLWLPPPSIGDDPMMIPPHPALRACFLKEILNIYHVLGEKRSGTGGNCVTAYEICIKSFHFSLVGK